MRPNKLKKKNRAMYEPEPEPEPTAPVTFGETHTCEPNYFFFKFFLIKIKDYISEY
jgi:hypothetical protein